MLGTERALLKEQRMFLNTTELSLQPVAHVLNHNVPPEGHGQSCEFQAEECLRKVGNCIFSSKVMSWGCGLVAENLCVIYKALGSIRGNINSKCERLHHALGIK